MDINIKKQYIECFLSIYLFKYGSFLALNLNTDKLYYLLEEEINTINSILNDSLKISINDNNDIFVDLNDNKNIDIDILKSANLLTWWIDVYLLTYIKKEFSEEFYNIIYPFFEFIEWDRYSILDKIDFIKYANTFDNFKLKKMLIFIYYWIANDSKFNTLKSIDILTEIMDIFPNFASFYLLRMRQKFNYIYKIWIWVSRFNQLIINNKWKEFIYKYKWIKDCFNDFEKANTLLPNYNIYYFFKWKFLLHLLDKEGLDYLLRYLKLSWIKNIDNDTNVCSWFGVYYLQIWDLKNAKLYLEKANYGPWDRYKEYSKLIFLYIKSKDKKSFFDFLEDKKKKIEVLLYNEWKYYRYSNWKLIEWKDIDDSYDHRTKMWYKLNSYNLILNSDYNNKKDYLENIFNSISTNYYDHWDTEWKQKVVFYSLDSFTFWKNIFLQKHDNK